MNGDEPAIPPSCYLAPPRPRAGTEPLARLPSSFEGGGCSPTCNSGLPSPSGAGGELSSGDLSPAAALCSLAMAVSEQRRNTGALPMTPEAQAVKKAIIASTTATAGDWHPLVPLSFTLPSHYLPVSPSKMSASQKKAAIEAAEAAAAARGEKLDSAAIAAMPLYSSREPTLRLTRVYCVPQKRVYFEVYPHVYELYKLKSSQDRNAMLKEMMEVVCPPERVVLPLPNLAPTGRKPHPCLLITAEGLRQVALKTRWSAPDVIAVINSLCAVCAGESVPDLLRQAEAEPEKVVMGQTWQRAWSGDEAPQMCLQFEPALTGSSSSCSSTGTHSSSSSAAPTPSTAAAASPAASTDSQGTPTAQGRRTAARRQSGRRGNASAGSSRRRGTKRSADDEDDDDEGSDVWDRTPPQAAVQQQQQLAAGAPALVPVPVPVLVRCSPDDEPRPFQLQQPPQRRRVAAAATAMPQPPPPPPPPQVPMLYPTMPVNMPMPMPMPMPMQMQMQMQMPVPMQMPMQPPSGNFLVPPRMYSVDQVLTSMPPPPPPPLQAPSTPPHLNTLFPPRK